MYDFSWAKTSLKKDRLLKVFHEKLQAKRVCGNVQIDSEYSRCFIDRKEWETSPIHCYYKLLLLSVDTLVQGLQSGYSNWSKEANSSDIWSLLHVYMQVTSVGIADQSQDAVDVARNITPHSVRENALMTQTDLRPKRNKMYLSQPIRRSLFHHRYFRLRNRDWKRVHIRTLARTVLVGLLLSNLTTPTRNRTLMALICQVGSFGKRFSLL